MEKPAPLPIESKADSSDVGYDKESNSSMICPVAQPKPQPPETKFSPGDTDDPCRFAQSSHKPLNRAGDPELGILYVPLRRDWVEPGGLRSSRSSSSLKHLLTSRLSNVFVNPTVVHRPNLRSRPSIQSMQSERDRLQNLMHDSYAMEETGQFNVETSANTSSPTGFSTGQTSLFSDISNKQIPDARGLTQQPSMNARNSTALLEELHTKSLTPIPEGCQDLKPCEWFEFRLPCGL